DLRLKHLYGTALQTESFVGIHLITHQYRLAQCARKAPVNDDLRFTVNLFGERLIDDVEVGVGVHHPQCDATEFVAELAHATSERFTAIGCDVACSDHIPVAANCRTQRG